MSASQFAFLPAVGILLLAALALPAAAIEASRIELDDGTNLAHCSFSVDQTYKVIETRCGAEKRTIGFSSVVLIIDANGVDITADVLGRYYRPLQHTTEPTPDVPGDSASSPPLGSVAVSTWATEAERRSTVPDKPFTVGLSIQGLAGLTIGDYFEGAGTGFGFDADLIFAVTNEYGIRFSVSEIRHSFDITEVLGGTIFSNDMKLNIWRYSVAVEYYSWRGWRNGSRFMWSVHSGIGLTSSSFSGETIVYDPHTEEGYVFLPADAENKFTFVGGAGLVHMLSSGIGLEASGEADLLLIGTTDGEYYGEVQQALILDLRVGIIGLLR